MAESIRRGLCPRDGRDPRLLAWAEISPTVVPTSTSVLTDGRVDVEVNQVVRALDGELLDERIVHHVYTFDDDRIVRMDVVSA
jgi:hypothetical protein